MTDINPKYILDENSLLSMSYRSEFLHERQLGTPYIIQPDEQIAAARRAVFEEFAKAPSAFLKKYMNDLQERLTFKKPTAEIFKNPEWYDFLQDVLSVDTEKADILIDNNKAFLRVLSPFIQKLTDSLIVASYIQSSDVRMIKSLQYALYFRLIDIAGLSLYVDFRNFCADLEEGPSPSLYHAWSKEILSGRWNFVAREYPVLIRFLHRGYKDFLQNFIEVIVRFRRDANEIRAVYFPEYDDLVLDNIKLDLSDLHHHGRTVSRLFFSNGRSLIYKPKSLANDKWLYDVLLPQLPSVLNKVAIVRTIDRTEYGWAEDVAIVGNISAQPSLDSEGIGKALGLLYALNACDMHTENIIIRGGKLFPIDLETILNASRKVSGASLKAGFKREDTWKVWTVLSTELIKYKVSQNKKESRGNGLSAEVAYAPFKKADFKLCSEEGVVMDLYDPDASVEVSSSAKSHDDYIETDVESIIKNFSETFSKICAVASTEKFYQSDVLKKCVIRSIMRDTMFYERILQRIYQPKLMKDAAFMSLDMAGLFFMIKDADDESANLFGPMIQDEILQILDGDIPLFWHEIESKDLMSSHGLVVDGFFENTSLEDFKNKIRHAHEGKIKEQEHLIAASFSLGRGVSSSLEERMFDSLNVSHVTRRTDIENDCIVLAKDIIDRAVIEKGHPAKWVTYMADTSGQSFSPGITGDSYYSGYWGILLFLSAVRHSIPDNKFVDNFLINEARHWSSYSRDHGLLSVDSGIGFSSLGGKIYTICSLYEQNPEWDFVADAVAAGIKDLPLDKIQNDLALDVIGGCAGLIFGLCRVVDSRISEKLSLEVQRKIVEIVSLARKRIIGCSQSQPVGAAWLPEGGEKLPLIGFAHGTAGILTAIQMVLDRASIFEISAEDKEIAHQIISDALSYQGSLKVAETGSWRDLRDLVGLNAMLNDSWCHGLPGLGIGFLSQMQNSKAADIKRDLGLIVHMCETMQTRDVDYYCCGSSGSLDFLLEASRCFNSGELFFSSENKMYEILHDLVTEGKFISRFGAIKPATFPGLFQGVSGIGYTALRFTNYNLPSISGFLPFSSPK